MSGNREAGAANGDRDQSTRASVEVILSFLTEVHATITYMLEYLLGNALLACSWVLAPSSHGFRALTALYLSRLSFTF